MPPLKEACRLYVTEQQILANAAKTKRDVQDVVNKVISTKAKLKFGIIDILDVVGAELLTAIESVAASVGQAALAAVSKAAAGVLEAILSEILKILLSAPTALFSLVSIPQSQAIDACEKERRYLSRASSNFQMILNIIIKWTSGDDGSKYYTQIKKALPYINQSLVYISDMIKALEGTPVADGIAKDSVFDEGKYQQLQSQLHRAIQITKPYSVINERLQLTSTIEADRANIYRKLEIQINKDFAIAKKKAAQDYLVKSKELETSVSETKTDQNIQHAFEIEKLKNQYSTQLSYLQAQKKLKLADAQMKATIDSAINGSNYVKAFDGIVGQFSYDMDLLGRNLDDLHQNITMAYTNYKLCQLMCNSVYNLKGIIKRLINEIINFIRKSGNVAGGLVARSLEVSQSIVSIVKNNFDEAASKFESPDKSISAIQLSQTVFAGNTMLSAADANMDATVTQSLIDLINSDTMLVDATGQFEKFISDLENIPDWDGAKKVWAVDMVNGAPSPYIKLLVDISNMMFSIPALAISQNKSERKTVVNLMMKANDVFAGLKRHNLTVANVLYSYSPYSGSEVGNLMRLLSNAGLLQSFALAMSLTQVIAKLSSDLISNFDDAMPNYDNCSKAYPEMFTDPELATAAVNGEMNVVPPEWTSNAQKVNEEIWERVKGLKKRVSSFFVSANPDDLKTVNQ